VVGLGLFSSISSRVTEYFLNLTSENKRRLQAITERPENKQTHVTNVYKIKAILLEKMWITTTVKCKKSLVNKKKSVGRVSE